MDTEISQFRKLTLNAILARQDESFRWGYDSVHARQRPEYIYYSPNFKSTLWTLVLLADIQAPTGLPQISSSLRLLTGHFHSPESGIFSLPGGARFPIPCLNGNMLYLNYYFQEAPSDILECTIAFFATFQRFDDGGFTTPKTYPYSSNKYCYGKHTCFWGVTKLLKGISFIPISQRTSEAQSLLENCIEFVLHHQVCFSSHSSDKLLHPDIGRLTFPNFYKSDFLEILWLLAREGVRDGRTSRALELLRSREKAGGYWELEKPMNTIVPVGQRDCPNAFITERARMVLDYYGR